MSNKRRIRAAGPPRLPVAYGLVGRDHPALHRVAEPVEHADEATRNVAARMLVTLSKLKGLALAAPQVGLSIRLVVTPTHAVANPTIHAIDEAAGQETGPEGCLTLPGRWFDVPRWRKIEVRGIDVADLTFLRFEATDLDARLWQHELDHLDGLLLSGRYPEVQPPVASTS